MLHDETKDVERQYNQSLNNLERSATGSIRAALREQELALYNAADNIGGSNETEIVAEVQRIIEPRADALHTALYSFVVTAAKLGVTTVSQRLPFNAAIGVDWNLPNKNAEQFALNYSYDLISNVQQTTITGIRQALTRWIHDGGKLSDLSDSIRPLIQDEPSTRVIEAIFNTDRANMIAVTEATRAYARGKIEGYTASGLAQLAPEKEPPAHVRCRCDVRPDSDPDGSWWWVWLTSNDARVCPVCAPLHKQRVGLAYPAPPVLDPAAPPLPPEAKIETFEQSIIGLSKERAAVYVDGKLQNLVSGTSRKVRFKSSELPGLIGRTVVHNHPGGFSFSITDIRSAWATQMQELRAIGITSDGKAWRHMIRPNVAFKQLDLTVLDDAIEQSKTAVSIRLSRMIQDGVMTREQVNNEYWHYLWLDVDERLGKSGARLNYLREAVYGNG